MRRHYVHSWYPHDRWTFVFELLHFCQVNLLGFCLIGGVLCSFHFPFLLRGVSTGQTDAKGCQSCGALKTELYNCNFLLQVVSIARVGVLLRYCVESVELVAEISFCLRR